MNPEDTSARGPDEGTPTPSRPEPASEPGREGSGRSVWHWAIAAAIVALLAYPIVRRMTSGSAPAPVAAPSAAERNLLNQSLQQYQAGHYEEAIQSAQELLKANPNSAEAYNNIAVSYLGMKRYDDAIQSATQALRVNPDFQLAKNNLAWIRQEKEKGGGGQAVPPPANTPENFLNRSLADYQAGRYQECIDAAREAIKLRPNYPEAYNNIGAAYASMGKWDEAIQNDQQALRLRPDFQLAKNNMAWAESAKKKRGN